MPVEMLDLEHLVGGNAREAALVRVVRAIGAMHREQPLSARLEIKLVNRVGEAVRAPPSGNAGRIAHCGEDFSRTRDE